ncbi:MAG TPA: energy transducer TonB [Flavobacterium sp.]|jgi:protein TonB
MNSVSIFEKGWLDLVFEGKNKEYGAYRLRQETSRTTLTALFLGVLLLASAIAIPVTINNLREKTTLPVFDAPPIVVELSNINPPLPDQPRKTTLPAVEKPTTDKPEQKQLSNPEIVKPSQADQDIAKNKDNHDVVPAPGPEGNTSPTATTGTVSGTGTATIPASGNSEGKIVTTNVLDKLPEFPGGMERFYAYVGRNFKQLEIEEDQVKVYVTFVIEPDGSMTGIRVARDPGYGVAAEAIRVLKSLKTKWSPGMINGQPVRTAYTMPITVKL